MCSFPLLIWPYTAIPARSEAPSDAPLIPDAGKGTSSADLPSDNAAQPKSRAFPPVVKSKVQSDWFLLRIPLRTDSLGGQRPGYQIAASSWDPPANRCRKSRKQAANRLQTVEWAVARCRYCKICCNTLCQRRHSLSTSASTRLVLDSRAARWWVALERRCPIRWCRLVQTDCLLHPR